ncbi:hypothetical protein FF38_01230 [Lucilia cuprina]|uniref:Homeobox domain-containing protein n=1 Tax=Lucilia cuprina TaxID=7375 RepID=A0A0L0BUN8_LUCCU|nr:hypothetical protein FF38_01230 [Lucilia cuprina]
MKKRSAPSIDMAPESSTSEDDENPTTSKNKKRRSTSPYGKTTRRRWSDSEKNAIYSIFGNLKELEKLPSMMKCLEAINGNPALKNRTPQQLKTWLDNQRRHK